MLRPTEIAPDTTPCRRLKKKNCGEFVKIGDRYATYYIIGTKKRGLHGKNGDYDDKKVGIGTPDSGTLKAFEKEFFEAV